MKSYEAAFVTQKDATETTVVMSLFSLNVPSTQAALDEFLGVVTF